MAYDRWLSTADVASMTGLDAKAVREILSALHRAGRYRGKIEKRNSWMITTTVMQEVFATILEARRLEQQAEAERLIIRAEGLIEQRVIEADTRRMQAQARRDASLDAVRARRDARTDRRHRRAVVVQTLRRRT